MIWLIAKGARDIQTNLHEVKSQNGMGWANLFEAEELKT